MKSTGVMRRIDDLGRIVIPKEIRKNLKIREGDSLEIFVEDEGKVILEKHSPLKDLEIIASNYVSAIFSTVNKVIAITDTDRIIAITGEYKKDLIGKKIHEDLLFLIESKNPQEIGNQVIKLTESFEIKKNLYISTILDYGDIIGAVFTLSDKPITESDKDTVEIAVNFLSEYLSS